MIVWILVIGLFLVFGAIGYAKGAIRMLVSFVGFVIALMLANPLSPLAAKLLPTLEVTNPVSKIVIPPLIVFALVNLIFIGLSFYVHRLVQLYFKYKTDGHHFACWERLNSRLGVPLGFLTATVYSLLLGLLIYIGGYATVQLAAGDNDPAWLRYLNQARTELSASGLDRTVAGFDKTPAKFYEIADLAGLIYNNPLAWGRMALYPQFLSLSERPDVSEVAADTDYLTLLQSQAPVGDILNHARTQALIENQELRQLFEQIDIKDLTEFIHTGKTSKFEDQKIVGIWKVDPGAVLTTAKRSRPDITGAQMIQIKRLATTLLAGVTLKAGTDNQVFVKLQLSEEMQKAAAVAASAAAAVAAAANANSTDPAINPELARRYGLGRPGGGPQGPAGGPAGISPDMARRYGLQAPGQPDAQAEAANTRPATPESAFTGKGTWAEAGAQYKIQFTADNGQTQELTASVDSERMMFAKDGVTLVFFREY